MQASNADQAEIDKFGALASTWWDPNGQLKTLHDINPLRLDWIRTQAGHLNGQNILDVGCGGGLLAESMAAEGAEVTGIDLSDETLQTARMHVHEAGDRVEYHNARDEAFDEPRPAQ